MYQSQFKVYSVECGNTSMWPEETWKWRLQCGHQGPAHIIQSKFCFVLQEPCAAITHPSLSSSPDKEEWVERLLVITSCISSHPGKDPFMCKWGCITTKNSCPCYGNRGQNGPRNINHSQPPLLLEARRFLRFVWRPCSSPQSNTNREKEKVN